MPATLTVPGWSTNEIKYPAYATDGHQKPWKRLGETPTCAVINDPRLEVIIDVYILTSPLERGDSNLGTFESHYVPTYWNLAL